MSTAPRDRFRTTHWSVVLAAGGEGADARTALATLCTTYWYALYAYARRRGHDADAAHDLVQGFLGDVIEKRTLRAADAARGRFRGFLATSFRRYCGHEHAKAVAAKRGGGHTIVSIDPAEGEARYAREPVDDRTPDQLFDRRWALLVIERALAHLREEYARRGRSADFAALEPHLDGSSPAPSYATTAAALGSTEGAVKVAVHRLRHRFREHLRAEVGSTVDDAGDVDAELRELLAAVR